MNRALRIVYLVLTALMLGSGRAEADIWDWLEALDGPGPSRSRGNGMANIFCSDSPSRRYVGRIFQTPMDPKAASTCLFVDVRRFHAEEDERFYPVDVTITEFGMSVRLHSAVELGTGMGWMGFSSRNPITNTEFEGTKVTISFPRLVFKPLLAAPISPFQNDADWGFIQLYFRETIVVGDLDQDDFASKPGTLFERRHQRVKSMGFIIDIPSAIRMIDKAFR